MGQFCPPPDILLNRQQHIPDPQPEPQSLGNNEKIIYSTSAPKRYVAKLAYVTLVKTVLASLGFARTRCLLRKPVNSNPNSYEK